jgi:hypothetical protein
MHDVTCTKCGYEFLDESSNNLLPLNDRKPCPQCGSADGARTINLSVNISQKVDVSASIEILSAELLLQTAIISRMAHTEEGALIKAIDMPLMMIIAELQKDPDFLRKISWDKMEELIAAKYASEGWTVELTHRGQRGDKGRDIIAVRDDFAAIRIVDQIKTFDSGRRVRATDIQAMIGVLTLDPNISKGYVTTTAEFAPGVLKDESIKRFMPYRLELRDGRKLLDFLTSKKTAIEIYRRPICETA